MRKSIIALIAIIAVVVIIVAAVVTYQYYNPSTKTNLSVFAAGSLSVPFTQLAQNFEKANPNINVQLKFAGSVSLMREIMTNGSADVYASADWTIIPQMYPNYAKYDIGFASNQMALVYNNQTLNYLHISSVNETNWYQILANPNCKFGFSDGNQDPAGYSALMVMALANIYYGQNVFQKLVQSNSNINLVQNGTQYYIQLPATTALQPNTNKIMIAAKETDLLPYLESNQIQFLWIYRSDAIQKGLPYIQLPDEINMGSGNNTIINNYYNKVHVYTGYGSSSQQLLNCHTIVYGVTIPTSEQHSQAAAQFIKYLLETNGQNIMNNAGQTPIHPAYVDNATNIPQSLSADVTSSGPQP